MKFTNLLAGAALMFASTAAIASPMNIGGVVWDPDATLSFPSKSDFEMNGNIVETALNGFTPGQIVTGRGIAGSINSFTNNVSSFCPGCELTFTFSMELVSASLTDFVFKDLALNFYVDSTPDYTGGDDGTAGDGVLWLSLALNPSNFLTGTGTNIGTGSDTGNGNGVLDVIGGLAMGHFDTNGEVFGGDMVLSSSFQPAGPGLLSGTFDLTGNSIPEPASLALLGLGLLGMAGARRRKA